MKFMPEPIWRKGPPFDVIELVGWRPPRCACGLEYEQVGQ